jgi:phospholipase C
LFDHVPPITVPTFPPSGAKYPDFVSLGVRVPAFIVSPFVEPGTIFSELLDHTSILKLIGQRFGPQGRYSNLVNSRAVGSVWDVLKGAVAARKAPTIPSLVKYLAQKPPYVGFVEGTEPNTTMDLAFQHALNAIHDKNGGPKNKFYDLRKRFPKRAIPTT